MTGYESVLIVSDSTKANEFFASVCEGGILARPVFATGCGEARRRMDQHPFDLLVINAPLRDEFGSELALQAAGQGVGVILLVKQELLDEVCAQVEEGGVYVVPKPFNRGLFLQAVRLVTASQIRLHNLQRKNDELRKRIEVIRLCDRAKCLLIQHLRMSEEDAHHFIEQQAMHRRVGKEEVARDILRSYEEER